VGSLTTLAFVLVIGRAERFQYGKRIASFLGLVPSEDSSGRFQRNSATARFPAIMGLLSGLPRDRACFN